MKPYQRYFLSIFILSTNGKERENISPGRIQTTLKVVEHVRAVKKFTTQWQSKGRKSRARYRWTHGNTDKVIYMDNYRSLFQSFSKLKFWKQGHYYHNRSNSTYRTLNGKIRRMSHIGHFKEESHIHCKKVLDLTLFVINGELCLKWMFAQTISLLCASTGIVHINQ